MGFLLLSVIVVNLARAADMLKSLSGPIKGLVDKSCTSAFLLESSIASDFKVLLDCVLTIHILFESNFFYLTVSK